MEIGEQVKNWSKKMVGLIFYISYDFLIYQNDIQYPYTY